MTRSGRFVTAGPACLALSLLGCPDQGLSTYNAVPVADILAPADGSAAVEGEVVSLRGQVSDSNDTTLDLVASWYVGDEVLCDGAPPSADGLTECTWTADLSGRELRLEVIDDRGASGTASATLVVAPNGAPVVSILAPTDAGTYYAGSLVEFDGTASDPEDTAELLVASWTSSIDGALALDATVDADGHSRGAVALSEGEHFIEFTVADSVGRSAVATVLVEVGPPRQEPSAMILEPGDGDVVDYGTTVAFVGMVSDGQDAAESLGILWTSNVDGTLSTAPSDSTGRLAFSTSSLSRGAHLLTLEVTDTDGNRVTEDLSFVVNGAPSTPGVALSPAEPRTLDDLVASITSASLDPDGDAVTYTWAWTRDGVASSESVSETLPASATSRGESWTVLVTPSDGLTSGPPGRATVTILNSAPVLDSVSFSPSTVLTNDVVVATSSAADDDGDSVSVSYAWWVDGAMVSTGASLDGATWFDKGDVVVLEAVASDGTDSSAPLATAPVTVDNSDPGAASATISPSSPAAGVDDIQCLVSASDADGDALSWTIEWTVDGVAWSGATTVDQPGDTVPADELAEAEVWTCTATASDGESSTAPATASATVAACPYGESATCPASSCAELSALGYASDGRYWVDPDGAGALEVWCDLTLDGGGWTLVSVTSDDGADTWTYTARRYWDLDSTTFGSLDNLDADYKSAAMSRASMSELLVVHQPSGTWATYPAMSDGTTGFAAVVASYGDEYCWKGGRGFEMGAGSLVASGGLCDTDLYLNAADHDGGGGSCTCADCVSHAHGPSWSVDNGDGCPFDDPGGASSAGPDSDATGESGALGFGAALGLNTGAPGAGENYLWILVR